ncbi:MAG: nucleotidyltransferase domain-containing protein [Nanoarchaeota archaeon]|nr:nucleotidyltransferase domain-containing protein [Nanoarchaeota archaeon]
MGDISQKWVNLLTPYSKKYYGRFTEAELSRQTNTPQQSASRYLKILVEEGIINYEVQGRNKLFFFNQDDTRTFIVMQMIENQKSLKFLSVEKKAAVLITELLASAESIIIFGSYASYSHKKGSDIDLIIIGPHDKDSIDKTKKRYTLEINCHYFDIDKFTDLMQKKDALMLEVMDNHIIYGNTSELVKKIMETR